MSPNLDQMLTRSQAAEWLQTTERALADSDVPVFKVGHKTARYHPRTIVAWMARHAGVPDDLIAASMALGKEQCSGS